MVAMMEEAEKKKIGKIVHYYGKIGVAIVDLEDSLATPYFKAGAEAQALEEARVLVALLLLILNVGY